MREDRKSYGIDLSDTEDLRRYLQNIDEMGGDPRKFVEFTREEGSVRQRIAGLREEVRQRTLDLQSLKEKEQTLTAAINASQIKLSDVKKQTDEAEKRFINVKEETGETERKNKQALARLALLLEVEDDAVKVIDAMAVLHKEPDRLVAENAQEQARLQGLEQRTRELEDRNRDLESQIRQKLGITHYANDLCATLAYKQSQNEFLDKELNGKKERLALADTVADFLTKKPDYDFNLFCSYVQAIKWARETGSCQLKLQAAAAEEEVRNLALKVFEGDLVSKREHKALQGENDECKRAKVSWRARSCG